MNNILNYYFNTNNELFGEDKLLNVNHHHNYFSQWLTFESDVPDIGKRMNQVMRTLLKNPESPLRLILSINSNRYCFTKRDVVDLTARFLRRVDTICLKDIERYTSQNGYTFVVFYTANSFCICCQHLFMDGVTANNITQHFFDTNRPFAIDQFDYIPVVHELVCMNKLIGCFQPLKRHLSYDLDYHMTDEYRALRFRHCLKKYKNLRAKSLKDVSFTTVIVAKTLFSLFDSVTVERVTIGILVGMKSFNRFNNYGIIAFEAERPGHDKSIDKYILEIHRLLEERKAMGLATFIASNVYEVDLKGYTSIDILFSGMPMTLDGSIQITGVRLQTVKANIRYTSMPVYCGYVSCDRYVHIYLNIRTNDIQLAKCQASMTSDPGDISVM